MQALRETHLRHLLDFPDALLAKRVQLPFSLFLRRLWPADLSAKGPHNAY